MRGKKFHSFAFFFLIRLPKQFPPTGEMEVPSAKLTEFLREDLTKDHLTYTVYNLKIAATFKLIRSSK